MSKSTGETAIGDWAICCNQDLSIYGEKVMLLWPTEINYRWLVGLGEPESDEMAYLFEDDFYLVMQTNK